MNVVSQDTSCFINFEPGICSDVGGADGIWILSPHFTYLLCICWVCLNNQNWAYHPLRIPFKIGLQRLSLASDGAYLEGPPWALSEICWESSYLASIKATFEVRVKKEYHLGETVAQVFLSHFNKTSWLSGKRKPRIDLRRMYCQWKEIVLGPIKTINAEGW